MTLLCWTENTWIMIGTLISGIFTAAIFWAGIIQLMDFRKTRRIEYTYKVDLDFTQFLNHPDNKIAKAWLLDDEKVEEKDYDQLRQLFDKIEGIDILRQRKVIDEKMLYGLLSYYIEEMFTYDKSPTLNGYIDWEIKTAKIKSIPNPDLFYTGVKSIYKRLLEIEKTK